MEKHCINGHNHYQPHGFGCIEYETKNYYIGNFSHGQYNGLGYLFTNDGKIKYNDREYSKYVYAGSFLDGIFCGQGQLIIFVDDTHTIEIDAMFENGNMTQGNIKYNVEEKYTYSGKFKNSKFHGRGELVKESETYKGTFYLGLYHDHGNLEKKENFIYNGYFNHGKIHGKGEKKYFNGNEYDGEFENDIYHGKGTLLTFTNKEQGLYTLYEGDFEYGQYHGKGKISECKKNLQMNLQMNVSDVVEEQEPEQEETDDHTVLIYEGHFKFDLYSGEGTLYDKNGNKKYEGNFEIGVYDSIGTLYNEKGYIIYKGAFKNGQYNGKGNLFLWDDKNEIIEEYFGSFLDGKKSGEGVVSETQNLKCIKYKGGFLNGFYDGVGSLKEYADDVIIKTQNGTFSKSHLITGKKMYYIENYSILCEEGKFVNDILIDGEIHYNEMSPIKKCVVKMERSSSNGRIFTEIFLKNGKQYIGKFIDDDSITGEGTIIFPNSTQYKGAILHGNMHGNGRLIIGLDNIKEGNFENDELITLPTLLTLPALQNHKKNNDTNNDDDVMSEKECDKKSDKESIASSAKSAYVAKKSFFDSFSCCSGDQCCNIRPSVELEEQ